MLHPLDAELRAFFHDTRVISDDSGVHVNSSFSLFLSPLKVDSRGGIVTNSPSVKV